ncbi:antibiotic biosynthesis monooxygenase [Streptomyces massasporeus]|uniref:antibiotic biosynthesis monooxygenase n=1 Tax=Streptomyces massasporeus TaxID=67324 RepID=UPI00340E25E3
MNEIQRDHASPDGAGAGHVLFILLDTPGPEEQRRLAAAVQDHIDTWVRHCPGYVSTRLHLAADGRTIVNHAQWTDEDHYRRNFQEDPRKRELDASIAAYATGAPKPIPCRVFGHG